MSTPKDKFYPNWKMTRGQHASYWKMLGQVCRAHGAVTFEARESLRKIIHWRAFGRLVSAKEIDHLKMFDAVKAAILAELQPENLAAQMRQTEQPLIRLRHACRALADESYILALVTSPRFKHHSLDDEDWTEHDLEQLRNTLAARAGAHARKHAASNAVAVTAGSDPDWNV